MNQLFTINNFTRVPDGTLVAPFLNSKDSNSGLPVDLLDDISIAAGVIEPGVSSKIHVMPLVTQITFVLQGKINICMKDALNDTPYSQTLGPQQAIITEPGTFFQLINDSAKPCQVLYIVSPAYVFLLAANGELIYDDAIVLDEDWAALAALHWRPATLRNSPLNPAYRARIIQQIEENSNDPNIA